MRNLLFSLLFLLLATAGRSQSIREYMSHFPPAVLPVVSYQANALTLAVGAGSTTQVAAPLTYRPATTYYIDSLGGNDANVGTDSAHAWKSLSKATSVALGANIGVYFKAPYTYKPPSGSNKGLKLFQLSGTSFQPLVMSRYGAGKNPIIAYDPSPTDSAFNRSVIYLYQCNYVIVDGLDVTDPSMAGDASHTTRANYAYAVNIDAGDTSHFNSSTHNIVRNCNFSLVGTGVHLYGNSNTVENCTITNTRMIINTPTTVNNNDDYGANGVVLIGSNNLVQNNKISQCWATSYDYTYDGGAIEVFSLAILNGCDNNQVLRNLCWNNQGYIEAGGKVNTSGNTSAFATSNNNIFAYNTCINSGIFYLINQGSTFHLTVSGTKIYNNTVINDQMPSFIYQNYLIGITSGVNALPTTGVLDIRNNVFYTNDSTTVFRGTAGSHLFMASQVTHTNNIFRLFKNTTQATSIGNFATSESDAATTVPYAMDATESSVTAATVLFNNTTNSDASLWDYIPAAGSPLIGKGTSLGYTADIYGNTLPTSPALGIAERVNGSSTDVFLDGTDFLWLSQYTGPGKSIYMEVVGSNGASVSLYTAGGALVPGTTTTVNSTSTSVATSAALTLYDGVTYKVGWQAAGTTTATLRQVRLVIKNTLLF